MHTPDPRQDRIRRLKATIVRDECELQAAIAHKNALEVSRLTRDLRNRRVYLAELLRSQVLQLARG
ncbi:MAG TPA: hypothetical protein VHB98_07725 [Chloroflexota bacterium]|jgi:hypothetical protein|nr:hypothetical protein [Chloroflexota bacterium]